MHVYGWSVTQSRQSLSANVKELATESGDYIYHVCLHRELLSISDECDLFVYTLSGIEHLTYDSTVVVYSCTDMALILVSN